MIESLALLENFTGSDPQIKEVSYTLKTKGITKGPLRSIQKFLVILLTTVGTDPIHPWLGTRINNLTHMNIVGTSEIELFVRTECESAISQFFKLQANESSQNVQTGYDVITTIELADVTITDNNGIKITFKFQPLKADAIYFSIDF